VLEEKVTKVKKKGGEGRKGGWESSRPGIAHRKEKKIRE